MKIGALPAPVSSRRAPTYARTSAAVSGRTRMFSLTRWSAGFRKIAPQLRLPREDDLKELLARRLEVRGRSPSADPLPRHLAHPRCAVVGVVYRLVAG